jgi:hypothetical protein
VLMGVHRLLTFIETKKQIGRDMWKNLRIITGDTECVTNIRFNDQPETMYSDGIRKLASSWNM